MKIINKTLFQAFEEQVEKTPESLSLYCHDNFMNYRQLNQKSNQLARYVLSLYNDQYAQTVITDQLIIVFMGKSMLTIVAFMGIQKSGAAYVPLDTHYPVDRLSTIIAETSAKFIFTTQALWNEISNSVNHSIKPIFLDAIDRQLAELNVENLNLNVSLNDLAYVIYTSGSTGKPKGVMIEHRGLAACIIARDEYYANRNRNSLLWPSLGFDSSITAIYWPLIQGGVLTIPGHDDNKDPIKIANLISEQKISHFPCTPSFYKLLLECHPAHSLNSLELIILGGEVCSDFLVKSHSIALPNTSLVNEYGPTEASVWSTSALVYDGTTQKLCDQVSIGKSAPHAENYILDADLNEVMPGQVGEIYVGGLGVARGYLQESDLTKTSFILRKDKRLYKTGDIAKYNHHGEIVFLGRVDQQIKLRGLRIELSEIELALCATPDIRDAIVRVHHATNGDELVAYVILKDSRLVNQKEIQVLLEKTLPHYMLPSAIIPVISFPLNIHGKIDHEQLPNPELYRNGTQNNDSCYISEKEKILTQIWCDVLKINRIGRHDRFFHLGGHSLLIPIIILKINQTFSAKLTIRQFLENSSIADLMKFIAHGKKRIGGDVIPNLCHDSQTPLSFAQERMWFLHQYCEEKDIQNNISQAITLRGFINFDALQKTLNEIIARHEIYRTLFVNDGNDVHQKVLPYQPFQLKTKQINLSDVSVYLLNVARQPFNLSEEPSILFDLLKIEERHHILMIRQHHIIHDGTSIGLLYHEIEECYRAYCLEKLLMLPVLTIQYADFSVWQRQQFPTERIKSQINYWKEKLRDYVQLDLPVDKQRPIKQTFNGKNYRFNIDIDLFSKLKKLSRQEDVSLYMSLLAGFYLLLYRYSGQYDIVIGTPIANRDHKELHHLIGPLINTVVLRANLKDIATIQELLYQIKKLCIEAYENKDAPFESIVKCLNVKRCVDRAPIFQVMFIYNYLEKNSILDLPGLSALVADVENNTSKYDLTFSFNHSQENLTGVIEYNTDLYSEQTITQMASHYLNLLTELASDATKNIHDVQMLSSDQLEKILYEWNKTDSPKEKISVIHELFQKNALKFPFHTAVVCGQASLTYEELNKRANQLAHKLFKLGIQKEILVAVILDRSLELPISLLAILKTGGGYVPLDPNYPKLRLQYILDNSEAPILITDSELFKQIGLAYKGHIIFMDQQADVINQESTKNLELPVEENGRVLVHYTSGSTGNPKGVMLEHGDLCYCFRWLQEVYPLEPGDCFLQHTLYSFDVFICELFWPLIVGATSVLVEPQLEKDVNHLAQLITKYRIKTIFCVPSMLALLLEDEDFTTNVYLKNVLSTGEALPIELKDRFYRQSSMKLYNLYGPTESTIYASYEYCPPEGQEITIGCPITGKQIYILNEHMQIQPVNVIGDLYIGGKVGRGYYKLPDLSAERFFTQSIHGKLVRLYKTGDIARYRGDGRIEFLGRSDFQVKLQGHRIELAEIETLLNIHPDIQKSVLTLQTISDRSHLIAYYKLSDSNRSVTVEKLRQYLAESIPSYMIPSFFVNVNEIPLTPSGKIDRKSLPEFTLEETERSVPYIAPRNDVEFKLAKMLENLLDLKKVGIFDNFFEIGGTSLIAVRWILEIKKVFNKTISVVILFKEGTIAALAKNLNFTVHDLNEEILLPIQKSHRSWALFLAHPVEGLAYLYTPLSAHMQDYTLYGLSNPYFYDRRKSFSSIEEMAQVYVEAIQKVQPKGPYYLCGWSSGGQTVYAMALQLQKQGEHVEAVILIDTYHNDLKIVHENLDQRIRRVLLSEGIDPDTEEGHYFTLEYKHNIYLLSQYKTPHYHGRVVLIKAQDLDKNIEDNYFNAWQSYIQQPIEVYSTPGAHGRLLDNEYIENLTNIFKCILGGTGLSPVLSNNKNSNMDNQLLHSAELRDLFLINKCLKFGANPFAKNGDGKTIFDIFKCNELQTLHNSLKGEIPCHP